MLKSIPDILEELKNAFQAQVQISTQDRPGNVRKTGPIDLSVPTVNPFQLQGPFKSFWFQKGTVDTDVVYLILHEDSGGEVLNALPVRVGQVVNFEKQVASAYLAWGSQGSDRNQPYPDSFNNAGFGTFYTCVDANIDPNVVSLANSTSTLKTAELKGNNLTTLTNIQVTVTRTKIFDGSNYTIDNAPTASFTNLGPDTIYIGDDTVEASVSPSGSTKVGQPIVSGQSFEWNNLADLYAKCVSGESAYLACNIQEWS